MTCKKRIIAPIAILWSVIATSTMAKAVPGALSAESNYICDCSYSLYCTNNSGISTSSAAYGVLNDVRINNAGGGPDYVRPGEASMGAIGLTAAAAHLSGADQTRANNVLGAYFRTWVRSGQAQASSGAIYQSVSYTSNGAFSSASNPNPAATGQMISAMWKYYKYTNDSTWLNDAAAFAIVKKAANFLVSNFNSTYNLEYSGGSYWTVDSAYAVPGLLCAVQWAQATQQPASVYSSWSTTASLLQQGLASMKDPNWNMFFRFRDGRGNKSYGKPVMIDQTCFSPYETNALAPRGDAFAGAISDSWTLGFNGSPLMTPYTSNSGDWRYFGTHLQSGNNNLSPGASLQLAKVEWKYGSATAVNRASLRYQWVYGTGYSNLWYGASGLTESGVRNGIVDWRDMTNYNNAAASWQRFIDTSAYMLEVTLMIDNGVDTTYTP